MSVLLHQDVEAAPVPEPRTVESLRAWEERLNAWTLGLALILSVEVAMALLLIETARACGVLWRVL